MILNKPIQTVVNKVAKELDIPNLTATAAYRLYWKFIKDTVEALPELENISEEDFNKLRVNFSIIGLGHFITTYRRLQQIDKFKRTWRERKILKDERNKVEKSNTSI
jgi:hypothetical protein